MGKDRSKTTQSSTTTPTATPQETGLEQNMLDISNANKSNQIGLNNDLFNVFNTILNGGSLGGNLSGIGGVNEAQTQSMVNSSLRDIYPQFQSQGILDSGTSAQIASRTAADIRNQNAQFNVTALQNLFNQAMGGSSNLQSTSNQNNAIVGSQLAGLRTINQSGSGSTMGMNPFLRSFQTSAGSSFGNAAGSGFGKLVF